MNSREELIKAYRKILNPHDAERIAAYIRNAPPDADIRPSLIAHAEAAIRNADYRYIPILRMLKSLD